jgi:4,5-DOPA dioxygenase extradiol
MTKLPTIFLNHGGGPLPILGDPSHSELTNSLKNLSSTLTLNSITAILIISAHWEESSFQVLTAESSSSIPLYFDYYGFPPETYKYQYSAPGNIEIANRVVSLLLNSGIKCSHSTSRQGFDHGVFIPLLLSFPSASIPIIQLSLKKGLDSKEHIMAGQALEPLRSEGVLILGSGMSFHNMQHFMGGNGGNEESIMFDHWLNNILVASESGKEEGKEGKEGKEGGRKSVENTDTSMIGRLESLSQWLSLAPFPRICHPREEHLAPLFVVAGAAGNDTPCHNIFNGEVLSQKVSSFAFFDDTTPMVADNVVKKRIESEL